MRRLLSILLLTFFLVGISFAEQKRDLELKPFICDLVSYPQTDSPEAQAYIYVWVKNTHFQFLKTDDNFRARYQINIEIGLGKKQSLFSIDSTYAIAVANYAETLEPTTEHIHRFRINLPAGKYLVKTRLLDLNTGNHRNQTINSEIQPYDPGKLVMSDLLLVDTSDVNQITVANVIPPLRIPIQKRIYVYAEIFNFDGQQPYKIQPYFSRKNATKDLELRYKLFTTSSSIKILLLELVEDDMLRGDHLLNVILTVGSDSVMKSKPIRFVQQKSDLEEIVETSLDEMIDQLQYIAEGDEWKKLRKSTGKEREDLFKQFWERRDPTPGTPENGLFDEYYRRIQQANARFRVQRLQGWRTERGRVFIVYGQPDTVDRTSNYSGSSGIYEVWYYDELRKRFVFWDELGFGDFRLISGII